MSFCQSSGRLCLVHLFSRAASLPQKAAVITPVLKKFDADPDELRNYRPISNLTFISKVIERIVADQIRRHLENFHLIPRLQSAYRQHHSTETALMKVISDILDAVDDRKVTLLGLLDLSAAFDTVDHNILLKRLKVSWYWWIGGIRCWNGFEDRKSVV